MQCAWVLIVLGALEMFTECDDDDAADDDDDDDEVYV